MQAEKIWEPSEAFKRSAHMTAYTDWLARERGLRFATYDELWQWSVDELEAFWQSVWDYFELHSATPFERVLGKRDMPGAEWFPGARVNFVEQVFRHVTDSRPALVFRNELGDQPDVSWRELERQVASLAAALRAMGVEKGDRVVAYLPNIPQTIVAFLACASIGAIWSVCSPDMGSVGVLDRFRQIEPKVLLACDGYRYAGKTYDRADTVRELLASLPTVRHLILTPNLDPAPDPARYVTPGVDVALWDAVTAADVPLDIEWLPFDHPLWVVYSSGTTGMPKPIVHGHGGILVIQVKDGALHNNVGADDRFHWYSSTGWIMWNSQVGALLGGATVCIFDGNPGWPDWNTLWRFVGERGITFFGAGAAFYASCLKAGVEPNEVADLSHLRALGSTGSPLSPESYHWIYDHVRRDIWLTPISGGTDFAGAFLAGNPTLPVYVGEMQCRTLGSAVYAYDDAGQPVVDAVGELVCGAPIPSMPLYFWNDAGNQRYIDSYFDMFPGQWRHGDWLRVTPRDGASGAVIYGRSDATINRHGIRMGTSELYRAVEAMPEVLDSLVVDLEYLGRESYMPLFVVLRDGHVLSADLLARICDGIKTALSARHVPNEVFCIESVPRTLSGKKLELPIKKLLLGEPIEKVVNPDAMANPHSLAWFVEFASRRAAAGAARRDG